MRIRISGYPAVFLVNSWFIVACLFTAVVAFVLVGPASAASKGPLFGRQRPKT